MSAERRLNHCCAIVLSWECGTWNWEAVVERQGQKKKKTTHWKSKQTGGIFPQPFWCFWVPEDDFRWNKASLTLETTGWIS